MSSFFWSISAANKMSTFVFSEIFFMLVLKLLDMHLIYSIICLFYLSRFILLKLSRTDPKRSWIDDTTISSEDVYYFEEIKKHVNNYNIKSEIYLFNYSNKLLKKNLHIIRYLLSKLDFINLFFLNQLKKVI